MDFDFKETIWRRFTIHDSDLAKELRALIEAGEIKNLQDVYESELADKLEEAGIFIDNLYDTAEPLPPEKNEGKSTMDIWNNDGTIIFSNAEKTED